MLLVEERSNVNKQKTPFKMLFLSDTSKWSSKNIKQSLIWPWKSLHFSCRFVLFTFAFYEYSRKTFVGRKVWWNNKFHRCKFSSRKSMRPHLWHSQMLEKSRLKVTISYLHLNLALKSNISQQETEMVSYALCVQ